MANGIKIGNLDISAFKVGSADTKVYLGDTLLYPTAPPSFQGKWLATYQDSHTESAACGSSSAITDGEINLESLVRVEIGDCVTSIDNFAFAECTSLTSVTIGNSVTNIGGYAFGYCESLTSVTVNATTPPTLGTDAFNNTTCPIYVPSQSVDEYKNSTSTGWYEYASRIQAIPT